MSSEQKQWMYASIAILSAMLTWYFNLRFASEAGWHFDIAAFIRGGFANYAASSLSADAMLAALTFIVWVAVEARRLRMRHWWMYIVLTGIVAVSFSFPFFLFMRERRMANVHDGF